MLHATFSATFRMGALLVAGEEGLPVVHRFVEGTDVPALQALVPVNGRPSSTLRYQPKS